MNQALDRIRGRASRNGTPTAPTAPAPRAVAVPEYVPFPVAHLPAVLRELVVAQAAAVGCDPAFAALPAIATVGAAIGSALVANPRPDWRELPHLWCATVGDSGTGKSPAADPFVAAAFAVEDALDAGHRDALARHDEAVAAWKDGPAGQPKPPPPVREYFAVDDITIERLIENLKSSPRGLLLAQDELAGWFGSFTRYRGRGGGSDGPRWLSMFDGRRVSYQRRNGLPREVSVPRAVAGVTGSIQPDVLRQVMADPLYVASGLAARLLFAYPPKRCPRWSDRAVPSEAVAAYRRVVAGLRALPFDPRTGPGRVGLDAAALSLLVPFHDARMAQADGLDGGPMAAALPKLARIALRLALIHLAATEVSAGRDPGRACIGGESMAAAIALAEWFANEAERVYAMLAERPEDADLRRLAELVDRKGGRMTARDLSNANGRKYPSAAAAEAALDTLATAGLGHWEESKPARGGWAVRTLIRTPGPVPDPDSDRHSPDDRHPPGDRGC